MDTIKLSRIIARMGSDRDGEIVASVEALRRVLAATENDFNDLAELVAGSLVEPPETVEPTGAESWARLISDLLDSRMDLTSWEHNFLFSVLGWCRSGRMPSEKQQKVIFQISHRGQL